MIRYAAERALQALPVLFLASVGVFLVLRLVPGDPAEVLAGLEAPPARVEEIRRQLGLNASLPEQYARWVGGLLRGDLGVSFFTGLAVGDLLRLSFPPTVELAVAAYIVALSVGIPLGVLGGIRARSAWDWFLSAYTVLTIGIPNFLVGILLLLVFTVSLGWLPAAGQVSILSDPIESLRHLVLPAFALGLALAAALARYTRTTIRETMGQDFIRTARAKGLEERTVVVRHALRASLIPVVTIAALQLGQILAGAVVVEQVFTRPGLGRLIVESVQNRDYIVVQSTLILLVSIFVGVNLAADVTYGLLDPRIRRR